MNYSTIRILVATLLWLALCLSAQAQPQCPSTPAVGTKNTMCANTAFVDKSKGTLTPTVSASLAACTGANEGTTAAVTDSTTIALGAIVTGSGSNHVLAYCDGSNWTVSGADNPGYNGGAWPLFTATLTADTGVISQSSASSYLKIGKTVYFQIAETLTIISGSPTTLTVTLPATPKRDLIITGRAVVAGGGTISARFTSAGPVSGVFRLYDGTPYPPVTGTLFDFSGTYEAN